jgi:hypothetical protein
MDEPTFLQALDQGICHFVIETTIIYTQILIISSFI